MAEIQFSNATSANLPEVGWFYTFTEQGVVRKTPASELKFGIYEYSTTKTFGVQDIVSNSGSIYISLIPNNLNNAVSDGSSWLRVSNFGKPAIYWNAIASFELNDIVFGEGGIYKSLSANNQANPLTDTTSWKNLASGGSLIDLSDTPNTYTGQENRILAVNSTEDGMGFIDAPISSPILAYDNTVTYSNGDVVLVDGIIFISLDDNNTSTDFETGPWVQTTNYGKPIGKYIVTIQYATGDVVVSDDGYLYRSLQDSNGGHVVTDTSWWENITPAVLLTDGTGEINSLTEKTVLDDNDVFIIEDSADGFSKRKVKPSTLTTTVSGSFTNANLDGDNKLTITHTHGLLFAMHTIYDGNNETMIPDGVQVVSNGFIIDLSSQGTISGTWNYVFKK